MMVTDFKRVLVASDLSDFSGLALKYGALFSRILGSEVTLLHVTDAQPPPEALLRRHADLYAPGSGTRNLTRRGIPAETILATARAIEAGLIIMSTHGRSGIERILLGSVTERVLRSCDRPVMTVCPFHFAVEGEITIRRILCPASAAPAARAALDYASGLARVFGAGLDRRSLDLAQSTSRILEAGAQMEADLLVIGSQHGFFSDNTVLRGKTSGQVARSARIPVITVPLMRDRRRAARSREANIPTGG